MLINLSPQRGAGNHFLLLTGVHPSMPMIRILGTFILVGCLLALPQGAWADSATWSAATNSDYNTLTNWSGTPASIPGTNPAEMATFTDTGSGGVGVGISAATTNAVGLTFSTTSGHNYTISVADGVRQGLTGVTTPGLGLVTLDGPGAYTLTGVGAFNIGGNMTSP